VLRGGYHFAFDADKSKCSVSPEGGGHGLPGLGRIRLQKMSKPSTGAAARAARMFGRGEAS